MSESRNDFGRKTTKSRSKKLNSKVDLTAMISVSFLLIIFFMLNNELARPQTLSLRVPDHGGSDHGGCYDGNRILTIVLGENDKLVLYLGLIDVPVITPIELKYGKNGIRKELLKINKMIHEYSANKGKPNDGLIVIIKPSKKSNYRNLVDILDEMSIVGIDSYSIVNTFTPEELKLVVNKA